MPSRLEYEEMNGFGSKYARAVRARPFLAPGSVRSLDQMFHTK
jgi:hypothetical protein